MKLDDKIYPTSDKNPCYSSGAIWVTRKKLAAYPLEIISNSKSTKKQIAESKKSIPYKETILLLAYVTSLDIESIVILWNEKRYVCSNIDAAFDFEIDPGGFNTKNYGRKNKL